MRVESRVLGDDGIHKPTKMLLFIPETKEESKIVDKILEGKIPTEIEGKVDLSDRYSEYYISIKKKVSYQRRVYDWMLMCFGKKDADNKEMRNHRFLEEALELVHACGLTQEEVLQLLAYVYNRPRGEIKQEVGGTMLTLAALCLAQGVDMEEAAEEELKRVWEIIDKIREKHKNKPKFGPLPQ